MNINKIELFYNEHVLHLTKGKTKINNIFPLKKLINVDDLEQLCLQLIHHNKLEELEFLLNKLFSHNDNDPCYLSFICKITIRAIIYNKYRFTEEWKDLVDKCMQYVNINELGWFVEYIHFKWLKYLIVKDKNVVKDPVEYFQMCRKYLPNNKLSKIFEYFKEIYPEYIDEFLVILSN